jgi:L-fuculose-phosphate aldolase
MSARSLRPFRARVAWAYRRLGELGLISGSSGNVSLRVGEVVLLTPTGIPFDRLREREIVAVDLSGRVLGRGFPSSEWRLHLSILQARPDVRAVVHTHSPFATVLACAEKEIPVLHDEGRLLFGERIPISFWAPPGTWELARAAVEALGQGKALLLSRHGGLTVAPSLLQALALAEKLEEVAKIYVLSRLL